MRRRALTAVVTGAVALGVPGLLVIAVLANKVVHGSPRWMLAAFVLLMAAEALVICAGIYAGVRLSSTAGERRKHLRPALFMALGWLTIAVACEISLRIAAVPTVDGVRLGAMPLLPFEWPVLVRNLAAKGPVVVQDDVAMTEDRLVGWDLLREHASDDGRYAVDGRGFRVERLGHRPEAPRGSPLIALLGDSFTFGEEVAFGETWGKALSDRVGGAAELVNVGVGSHGVDQTLLKYLRDVSPLKPKVVIFSFLNGMPLRTQNVYSFTRPEREFPYSKPRFLVGNGRATLLNVPTHARDESLASPDIRRLPHIEHDAVFAPTQWNPDWRSSSYIWRYLISRFPQWSSADVDPEVAGQAAAVLTEALVDVARGDGADVLIVFLPTLADLEGRPTRYRDALERRLRARSLEVFDASRCILKLPGDRRFLSGGHYTPAANAAIADCLRDPVRHFLG